MLLWSRFVSIENETTMSSNQIIQFKEIRRIKIASLTYTPQYLQFEAKTLIAATSGKASFS